MAMLATIYKLTGVLTLAAAAVFGSSIPRTHEPSFLLCTGKNFTGYCVNLRAPSGVCVNLTDDLNDKVSSMQGAEGNTCLHFVAPDCSIDDLWFHWDSFPLPDLAVTPTHDPDGSVHNYEDQLSSIECWADDRFG
ncbi:hypothetical protein ONS95_002594 [Cadophora gregata]|uniref:uncharacterized protein n=1 Tax=Cadophora gregata TaxID=51156 RepID=UPI0026DCA308|nr:uncharacterized protein ONS95_002594 [Cadophora gregata]KAK0109924.1 hypothetical protein ONS95_002594 [Cadophora gregata]KAK0110446.1 hypothetical protein ONS96_002057 [Cadophora gregata f. sp. sojae]